MSAAFAIRLASESDVSDVLALIKELAEYEHLSHEVTTTESELRASLFGPKPAAEVVLAEADDTAVGFAVFFHNYSTFLGRAGIYLEDLFVRPPWRRQGIGKALLKHVARTAVERRCGRFEWAVLDWNTPAIDFYKGAGARPMDEWTVFRLTGEALARFAGT
jgi:GNAT superfamily N-acetyltransferase